MLNGKNGGKFVNGDALRDILSDEELRALLDEVPPFRKREEDKVKSETNVEGNFTDRDKEVGAEKAFALSNSDFKFVNTFVLPMVSEFMFSVSSFVNVPLEVSLTGVSKEEIFSKQDLLLIKGEIAFTNILKASYPVFLTFPKELFPLIVDSLFSNSKLSKYPPEFVSRITNSAVDWDIVKFFWSYLFLALEEVTTREFARAKAVIKGSENSSAEVVAYSFKHSLLRVDMSLKLHIWKFTVSLFIDYGFVDICNLLYQGILKESIRNWKELLREKVMNSSVEVEARIFYSFTLRRLLSLKKGDVLSFSPENVSLVINGEPKFRTKLGTVDNNLLAVTLANGEEKEGAKQMKEVGGHGSA